MNDDVRKKLLEDTERRINEHGWTAVAVLPDETQPTYTYSIAFQETYDHPEVVFIGFDPKLSQQLIAGIADGLKSKDLYLPPNGGLASRVIRDFDVLVRIVPEPYASRLARGAAARVPEVNLRLLQVCLPDAEGRQVDDPDCNPQFRKVQSYTQFTS